MEFLTAVMLRISKKGGKIWKQRRKKPTRIASLTFYKRLLSADIRLKTYFEQMNWPTDLNQWKTLGQQEV